MNTLWSDTQLNFSQTNKRPIPTRFKFVLHALALIFALALWMTPTARAAFPGANGKLAFVSNRDGNDEIYVMNSDGSGQTNLTNNAAKDGYPAWSPDGKKIAFVSNRDGNDEIYMMNADGTGVVRLTNNAAGDSFPAWSPDGRRIVFASLRNSPWKIYTMDTADTDSDGNGDNLIRLTNGTGSDYIPAWSPDGSKIAFVSDRTGFNQIFVMNATNGSGQIRLTTESAQDTTPNWSPDGSRITFASTRTGNYDIYAMDPVDANSDGSGDNLAHLTNNTADDYDPTWSPDSSKIAFHTNRDGNQEIYVMNANGSSQTNLSNNSADDLYPDWQPLINIAFNPLKRLVQNGNTTTVNIDFNSASNLYGYQFQVNYDSSKVSAVGAFVNTWFDTTTNANVPPSWNASCSAGVCKFAATKVSPATPLTGSGTVAQITFTGIAVGNAALTLSSDIWSDPDATSLTHTTNTATVVVYGTATVNGTVNLQGRATPLDTTGTVTLTDQSGTFSPTVVNFGSANGNFSATVPVLAGGTTYNIVGAHSLYLSNQYSGLNVTSGGTFSPAPATTKLLGGDANNDGTISIADLTCIGGAFGGAPVVCGTTGSSDINADSTTNILDLVLTGGNYNKSSPQTW